MSSSIDSFPLLETIFSICDLHFQHQLIIHVESATAAPCKPHPFSALLQHQDTCLIFLSWILCCFSVANVISLDCPAHIKLLVLSFHLENRKTMVQLHACQYNTELLIETDKPGKKSVMQTNSRNYRSNNKLHKPDFCGKG